MVGHGFDVELATFVGLFGVGGPSLVGGHTFEVGTETFIDLRLFERRHHTYPDHELLHAGLEEEPQREHNEEAEEGQIGS